MCMNCGCGLPDESHGKPENITASALRRAAIANDQSLRTSAQHIVEAVGILEREGSASGPGRTRGAQDRPHR